MSGSTARLQRGAWRRSVVSAVSLPRVRGGRGFSLGPHADSFDAPQAAVKTTTDKIKCTTALLKPYLELDGKLGSPVATQIIGPQTGLLTINR